MQKNIKWSHGLITDSPLNLIFSFLGTHNPMAPVLMTPPPPPQIIYTLTEWGF